MKPVVIDISHHNTIPESLAPAKASGIIGVIHKVTEGSSYVDDKALSRYHLAKDAGMAWGCYHFLNENSSGKTQAEFFVKTMKELGILDEDTLVAADHEDSDAALKLLREFLIVVAILTKRVPVVYSGHVLKEQLASYVGPDIPIRLWLAQYTTGQPTLPNGFDDYWIWQYTDQGEVPGINPPVDLNSSKLTNEELLDDWAGRLKRPEPEPEPEEFVYTIFLSSKSPIDISVEER